MNLLVFSIYTLPVLLVASRPEEAMMKGQERQEAVAIVTQR